MAAAYEGFVQEETRVHIRHTGPGTYFVEVLDAHGRVHAITDRASRDIAWSDAIDILQNGLVEGGRRVDVRGVKVVQKRGPGGAAFDCDHRHPPEVPSLPCEPAMAGERADVIYEDDAMLAAVRDAVGTSGEAPCPPGCTPAEPKVSRAKPKPLKWHRDAHGYKAKSTRLPGTYYVRRQKPNRRKDILPIVLMLDKQPLKSFETKGQAQAWAESYDEIVSFVAPHGKPIVVGEGGSGEARDAGPFATVERNIEDVRAGKAYGQIKTVHDVYRALHADLMKESQEVFLVLPVSLHGELLCRPVEIARGQRDRVNVDDSDVLRPIIATNAAGFFVCHNHPSTHARPSDADRRLTVQIQKAAKRAVPNVAFLDHVVIGDREYCSIFENKLYKL